MRILIFMAAPLMAHNSNTLAGGVPWMLKKVQ